MRAASKEEIQEFADEVRELFGDRLDSVILYGSHARGEALPGSDVDIAVIVDEKKEDDRRKLQELRSDYLLDEDIYFSPRVFSREEFEEKLEKEYSFYQNITSEGVEV